MKVSDVMHVGVTWVTPDTAVSEIVRLMAEQDIGSVPVGEDGHLLGMVTDRDIALRAVGRGRDAGRLTAREVMTVAVVCCRSDDPVSDAVLLMEAKRIRRLPVVDAGCHMVGMLALGDIAHRANRTIAVELIQAITAHHRSPVP